MPHKTCHGEPIVYPELAEGNRFSLYKPFDKLRVTLHLGDFIFGLLIKCFFHDFLRLCGEFMVYLEERNFK
jgi:hypothetical protein